MEFYKVLENDTMEDSLTQVIEKKYPNGKLARKAYAIRLYSASSIEEKLKVLEDYNSEINVSGYEKDYMLNNIRSKKIGNNLKNMLLKLLM